MKIRLLIGVMLALLLVNVIIVSAQTVNVTIPNSSKESGSTISIPINISDVSGLNIYAFTMKITFNQNVLVATGVTITGTVAAPWGNPTNSITSGQIEIAGAGTAALSGSGILLYINFNVVGSAGSQTTIIFSSFLFNEGQPAANTSGGTFSVPGGGGNSVNVSINNQSANSGAQVSIPVNVSDLSGKNVFSYSTKITFDQNVLKATGASVSGSISQAWGNPTSNISNGSIEIAGAGSSMLSGAGVLVYLNFDVIGLAGTQSSMNFNHFQFNDGNPNAVTTGGIFSVSGNGVPVLNIDRAGLNYSNSYANQSFKISNSGGGTLTWSIPSKPSWISAVTPSNGTGEATVTVTVDRNGLTPGNYLHGLTINSNGGDLIVDINMSAGPNMIVNGDFASYNVTWDFWNHAQSTANCVQENEKFIIEIQNSGMESWHVQLYQSPVVLIQGKTYEVIFDAYALYAGQIQVQAGMAVDPWTPYYNGQYFNLTFQKQTFSFSFKMEAADDWNCRLLFNLAYGVNKIYFDNIVMREKGGSSVQYNISQIPETCQLEANFPNPFNPSTNLRFSVVQSSRVQLDIFDVNGRLIETLLNGIKSPGSYTMQWQARNLPGGVYFCRFIAMPENGGNNVVQTRKLLLLK